MTTRSIYIFIVSLVIVYGNVAAQEIKNIQLTGEVQVSTGEVVPFAFIANSETGIGKETNEKGRFKIQVCMTDTILFRSIGYEDGVWPVVELDLSQPVVKLEVQAKQYALETVDVLWYRSYATFRHKVANMAIIQDKPALNISSGYDEHFMADLSTLSSSFAKPGAGVNFLAIPSLVGKVFTKRRAPIDAVKEARDKERLSRLTCRENLKAFTGFEDAKLDSFIVFLRSKHNIDSKLPDYEIMEAINLVYEDFLAFQTDSIAQ